MENALLRTASYFKRTGLVAVLYLLFSSTPKSLTASSARTFGYRLLYFNQIFTYFIYVFLRTRITLYHDKNDIGLGKSQLLNLLLLYFLFFECNHILRFSSFLQFGLHIEANIFVIFFLLFFLEPLIFSKSYRFFLILVGVT